MKPYLLSIILLLTLTLTACASEPPPTPTATPAPPTNTPAPTPTVEAITPTPQPEQTVAADLPLTYIGDAQFFYQMGTAVFVDARTEAAFRQGYLPRAQHLPPTASTFRLSEETILLDSTRIIVYGERGPDEDAIAVAEGLIAAGYDRVSVLQGGFHLWRQIGLEMGAVE
jgi:rhodanese-related sulfurtransferase